MLRWIRSGWIRFWFSAQMAWHGILANPLRSALTILGVTIGVAAVVSLMGIGEGARQAVVNQFKSLGANVIVVKATDPEAEFEADYADQIAEMVPQLQQVTPVVYGEATVRWRRERGIAQLLGVNSAFPEIRDHPVISGHFLSALHIEQRSQVVVLGYNVAAGLMGGRSPVGQTLTLDGRTFRIIGVLAPKGPNQAEGIDDKFVIPYTTALQLTKKKTVPEIWGKAVSALEADLATVQLGRIISRKLGLDPKAPVRTPGDGGGEGPDMPGMPIVEPVPPEQPERDNTGIKKGKDLVTITNLNQLVQEADKANRVMTLLLGGIAAVSLLVGGLGIMNIMLVAVTERTKEIGVRRALGAKQGDLIIQFMLEAFYLSGIGAIAGVAAGIWGTSLFAQYGFETAISLQAIQIAAGVALATGLLFGIYPAISASSVPPVEALRR
ncbi:MAG: FtsX-like permease family protein [Firmicutes bacterium]|nr:FtsX-like permease family protein [Bacillota bacterium]